MLISIQVDENFKKQVFNFVLFWCSEVRAHEVEHRQGAPTDYSRFLYLISKAAEFELGMEKNGYSWNPTIFNIIRWDAGTLGWWDDRLSIIIFHNFLQNGLIHEIFMKNIKNWQFWKMSLFFNRPFWFWCGDTFWPMPNILTGSVSIHVIWVCKQTQNAYP